MFPRIITVRRNGRTYRYLAIVESYREGGKKKQRQVGSLGNIDRYSPEQIMRLIEKLRGFLSEDPLGTVKDLETCEVRNYGVPYVVSIFWERLGLPEFISSRLSDRQVAIDVDLCTRVMVLNRLMAPRSKLAVSRWADKIYLPGLDNGTRPGAHQYYRAMDYLLSMKEELEAHLYHRLTDLLTPTAAIVTSFEVTGGNEPDGTQLPDQVNKDEKKGISAKGLAADKAYDSADNHKLLKEKRMRNEYALKAQLVFQSPFSEPSWKGGKGATPGTLPFPPIFCRYRKLTSRRGSTWCPQSCLARERQENLPHSRSSGIPTCGCSTGGSWVRGCSGYLLSIIHLSAASSVSY